MGAALVQCFCANTFRKQQKYVAFTEVDVLVGTRI